MLSPQKGRIGEHTPQSEEQVEHVSVPLQEASPQTAGGRATPLSAENVTQE